MAKSQLGTSRDVEPAVLSKSDRKKFNKDVEKKLEQDEAKAKAIAEVEKKFA